MERQGIKTQLNEVADYWVNKKEWLKTHLKVEQAKDHCWRCGEIISSHRQLQRCHIVPLTMGGVDEPNNYVLLCKACHIEGPDVNDKDIMWDWINAYSKGDKANFWTKRGLVEYEKLYSTSFVDDLYALNLSTIDAKRIENSFEILFDDFQMVFHFGHTHVSIASTAGFLRIFLKKLYKYYGNRDSLTLEHSLERIDYSTSLNLASKIISFMAEFERNNISSRTKDSLDELRKNGKTLGRPIVIDKSIMDNAIERYMNSTLSYKAVSKEFGISDATLCNAVNEKNLTRKKPTSKYNSDINEVTQDLTPIPKTDSEELEILSTQLDLKIRLNNAIDDYMLSKLSKGEIIRKHLISLNLFNNELNLRGLKRKSFKVKKFDHKKNESYSDRYNRAIAKYMDSKDSINDVAKEFRMSPITFASELKKRNLVRKRYRKTK